MSTMSTSSAGAGAEGADVIGSSDSCCCCCDFAGSGVPTEMSTHTQQKGSVCDSIITAHTHTQRERERQRD